MALKLVPRLLADSLSNLFRKTATAGYPKVPAFVPEGFRGKIEINEKCISCGACVRACPALAIKLDKTKISVWTMRCINCCRCVEVCPVKAANFTSQFEIVSADRNESYVRRYVMAKCRNCGTEFENLRKLEFMAEKTKQPLENFLVCPQCKPAPAAPPRPAGVKKDA